MELALVVIGALLAWLASLYGARKEAKQEHARWRRDERYRVWSEVIALCYAAILLRAAATDQEAFDSLSDARKQAYVDAMRTALDRATVATALAGTLRLLGPTDVASLGTDLMRRVVSLQLAGTEDAETAIIEKVSGGLVLFADIAGKYLEGPH